MGKKDDTKYSQDTARDGEYQKAKKRRENDKKHHKGYYDDDEYNKVKNTVKGSVKRCKGLGTLEPEEARESMFTDEFQRMDTMEYTPEAMELLEQLMGENVEPRRDFIFKNVDFSEIAE